MGMSESVATLKTRLRDEAKALRQTLDMAVISRAITDHLTHWTIFQTTQVILAYQALPLEVSLNALINAFSQKQWYLPRVMAENTLVFHRYHPGDVLMPNRFGILEPQTNLPVYEGAEPPLVLVPALMIDPLGHRLGFGKGYYDRFLRALSASAVLVTPIPQALVVDALPTDSWDVPVHFGVTESGILTTQGSRQA